MGAAPVGCAPSEVLHTRQGALNLAEGVSTKVPRFGYCKYVGRVPRKEPKGANTSTNTETHRIVRKTLHGKANVNACGACPSALLARAAHACAAATRSSPCCGTTAARHAPCAFLRLILQLARARRDA